MGVLVPSTEAHFQSTADRDQQVVSPLRAALTRPARSLWFQSGLLFVFCWLYHLWLSSLMQRGLLHLGAVSHKLAPLYAYWDPRLKTGLLLALTVLAGYVLFLRRYLTIASTRRAGGGRCEGPSTHSEEGRGRRTHDDERSRTGRMRHASSAHGPGDWKTVALLTAWMPVLAIAVAGIDGNLTRIARPFDRTDLEYYGAVARVGNLRAFIGTYPQRAAEMPMHAQTHPPGAVLFLWAATRLVGDTALRAALAAIFFSALSVPAVYLLARDLGGASLARLSAALYLLMPGVVLFTATSMDGPFAVLLIWSIYLGWRSAWRCSVPAGFAAGVVLALAAWMTFSASVAALFVLLAVVLAACRRARTRAATAPASLVREGRGTGTPNALLRTATVPLLAILAGVLAVYLPLYAATGYHPADMLGTAMSISHHLMAQTGHVTWAQHWHIAAANLVVFFAFCGAPLALLWLRQTARLIRTGWFRSALGTAAVAFVAALVVADLLPLYSLETERIWIFLAPLVAIPAAAELLRPTRVTGPPRERPVAPPNTSPSPVVDRPLPKGSGDGTFACVHARQVRSVLVLLATQTVLTELLLCTYW